MHEKFRCKVQLQQGYMSWCKKSFLKKYIEKTGGEITYQIEDQSSFVAKGMCKLLSWVHRVKNFYSNEKKSSKIVSYTNENELDYQTEWSSNHYC